MDDYTNITLQWDNVNKVELAHRIYRSESPIDTNNLPHPVATIPRRLSRYTDKVESGKVYYYRVSAVGSNTEKVSAEAQIFAMPQLTLYFLGDSSVMYWDAVNAEYQDLFPVDTHRNLRSSRIGLSLYHERQIKIHNNMGGLVNSISIDILSIHPFIDYFITWSDLIVAIFSREIVVISQTGVVLHRIPFSVDIENCTPGLGGYLFSVTAGNRHYIYTADGRLLSSRYNSDSKVASGITNYAIYNNNSISVYSMSGDATRFSTNDIVRAYFDQDDLLIVITNTRIITYDTRTEELRESNLPFTVTYHDAIMDDNGDIYLRTPSVLRKFDTTIMILTEEWTLPSGIKEIALTTSPKQIPSTLFPITYVPLNPVNANLSSTTSYSSSDEFTLSSVITNNTVTALYQSLSSVSLRASIVGSTGEVIPEFKIEERLLGTESEMVFEALTNTDVSLEVDLDEELYDVVVIDEESIIAEAEDGEASVLFEPLSEPTIIEEEDNE